jgi:hypothetical protein
MRTLLDFPRILFVVSLLVLWLSARLGASWRKRRELDDEMREDFGVVLAATLTLLGLIIAFTFSMATTRYDLRKNYEEAEANAIGTEYVRADLMPPEGAAKMRTLLRTYIDQRILFYTVRDQGRVKQINDYTAQLQSQLWSSVTTPAKEQPTPVIALAVAGMNDVLNSQGYTQAAWWNRIPTAGWVLMIVIAICCNLLMGFAARRVEKEALLLTVLPLILSISFFLIADIDSPRGGLIRIQPQNLVSLRDSLPTQ